MEYMTKNQQKKYRELVTKWSKFKELDVSDELRLEVMACVIVEMEKLQEFVNVNGPTYTHKAKSGDIISRARPEYQQLQECRQRLGVLVDKMNSTTSSTHDDIGDFVAL